MGEENGIPNLSRTTGFRGFRYVVAVLLFFGVVNTFMMRVNLSVAIVSMVEELEPPSGNSTHHEVPSSQNGSSDSSVELKRRYDWDIKTQSWILGSFFYGYAIFQLPCSVMIQRYGGKWMFGIAIFITSLLTLLTPWATEIGAETVIVARVLQGIVQGTVFPAVYLLIARWIPVSERNRIFTFVASGSAVGNIVGMSFSGYMANSNFLGGWPSTFYTAGAVGCLWFILWTVLVSEAPSYHPWISLQEKGYIELNLEKKWDDHQKPHIPWISILTSKPMWAYVIALLGHSLGLYIVMTEMPTYLSNIMHFDIKTNGVLCAVPFLLQTIFGQGSGYLADFLRLRFHLSNTAVRKLINSIAIFSSGACIILVGLVGRSTALSVTLLCMSAGLNAICYAGCVITCVEMSPTYSAAMLGISLSVSNLAGAVAPYLVGEFTSGGQTVENWTIAFAVTGVIMIVTGIVFDLFASAEVQPWDQQKCAEEEIAINLPKEILRHEATNV